MIVGRDEELRVVEAAFAEPKGAVVLITGEAGIGKTTLWEAATAAAETQGRRVMSVRPLEAERPLGLAALADLLEPVVDEVLPTLPVPQRHAVEAALLRADAGAGPPDVRTLGTALVASLRTLGGDRGLVLAVDDFQWLDATSRTAFDFALRRLTAARASAVLALRTGDAEDGRPALDPRSRVCVLEVGPLSLESTRRLLADRLGVSVPRALLRRVHAASGGSPLYAIELVRAGLAEGAYPSRPRGLPGLLRERIVSLRPSTRRALAAAAALAEPRAELVESEGDLQPALDAGVISIQDGLVRFSHPLLASTAESLLAPRRRRELHARLADLVDDPEQRATHLAAATPGEDEFVAGELESAAARAAARGAPLAAGELLELAAERSPHEKPTARRVEAAYAYWRGDDVAAARRLAEAAVDELPAGPRRAVALALLSQLRLDDFGVSVALAEQAWREARGDVEAEAVAAARLSHAHVISGNVERALEFAWKAVDRADRLADTAVVGIVAGAAFIQLVSTGRIDPELLARGIAAERRSGGRSDNRGVRWVLAMQMLLQERYDAARDLLEELVAQNEALGYETRVEELLDHRGELELRAGRPAAAASFAARATEMRAQAGVAPSAAALSGYVAAHAAAQLGRVEEARALTGAGLAASAAAGEVAFGLNHAAVLGFLELSLGDADAAAAVLAPAVERLRTVAPGMHPAHIQMLPNLIEALIAVGRADEARVHLQRLEERGRELDSPWALAAAARARGLLAAATGDVAGALEQFELALQTRQPHGAPLEHGRMLLARGVVQRRSRRWAASRASLAAALAIFDQIGAALWSAMARTELDRIGGRAAATGLTPTEQRVAALVALGRSNKEVARELFVTVRTVESNLSRIYGKLAIRSRTELAARLREPGGEDRLEASRDA